MASLRPLIRFSSYKSRVLTVKTAHFTQFARHSSAICNLKTTTNFKSQTSLTAQKWCVYRYVHDDKTKVDPKQLDEKLHGEKEGKEDSTQDGEKQLTQVQRLKKVFAEYGSTAIAFHVCISLTSLSICYCAVQR